MSAQATAPPGPVVASRRPFTRQEFERAGELGLFRPDERLELIGGEVIRKMSPQKTAHATGVCLAQAALERAFGTGHCVRVQLPLALSEDSEPEPDVSVVIGSVRDYEEQHPNTAVLVVEVADTTLAMDRDVKASLYASAAIPEYWIVNLQERIVEVRREPSADPGAPFARSYRSLTRVPEGEAVVLVAAPAAPIPVVDLLPRLKS